MAIGYSDTNEPIHSTRVAPWTTGGIRQPSLRNSLPGRRCGRSRLAGPSNGHAVAVDHRTIRRGLPVLDPLPERRSWASAISRLALRHRHLRVFIGPHLQSSGLRAGMECDKPEPPSTAAVLSGPAGGADGGAEEVPDQPLGRRLPGCRSVSDLPSVRHVGFRRTVPRGRADAGGPIG